jgi:hypothetical protein
VSRLPYARVDRPDRQAGDQLARLPAYTATAASARGVHGCLQAVQTIVFLMASAR